MRMARVGHVIISLYLMHVTSLTYEESRVIFIMEACGAFMVTIEISLTK